MRKLCAKKGDASDPLVVMVLLFFFAISFIVGIFVNTKIQNIISDTALNQTAAYPSINSALEQMNTTTVQRAFVMIFGLMVIFVMASAFMIRVHPVFIFIYIISLIIIMFVSIFVGNIYYKIQTESGLSEIAENQPMINFIMNNILKITMGVGGLSILIIFAKLFQPQYGSGGQF